MRAPQSWTVRDGRYWILDPRSLKPAAADLMTWAHTFEETERRLLRTEFHLPTGDRCFVSTVFLGINHGWRRCVLFETMIFGPVFADEMQWRCRTAVQAKKQHRRAVRVLRAQLVRAGVSPRRFTVRFTAGA